MPLHKSFCKLFTSFKLCCIFGWAYNCNVFRFIIVLKSIIDTFY